jgi:glyoxylase-like metal-dependent hydrolase (beta-lactamase superfamily II)
MLGISLLLFQATLNYGQSISSLNLKSGNDSAKIHCIKTGETSVKKHFLKAGAIPMVSVLKMLFSKQYTEYLPIYVYVIEHKEGVFIIDTGETAENTDSTYLKNENKFTQWASRRISKNKITRNDELDVALQTLNIKKEKINKIILTHLHGDHIGNLKYFEGVPVYVNRVEYEKPYGFNMSIVPTWFTPILYDLKDSEDFIFKQKYSFTKNDDLIAVPTTGHTHGHCSVIFTLNDIQYFFDGDDAFSLDHLINEIPCAVNISYKATKQNHRRIKEFSKNHRVVFLPAHDPMSSKRLLTQEFLKTE